MGSGPSDSELLARYVEKQDAAAFEMLLRRHAGQVIGVCRRLLGAGADADDAFQATFLLLSRKAGSIRKRASVGTWLHGAARRLSQQLLAKLAARFGVAGQGGGWGIGDSTSAGGDKEIEWS
jgi:DNA-directed RNA polymerase specialized sigma24 family protein